VSAQITCIEIFFDVRIRNFRTLNVVSGEWYGEKILEKIPSVPLAETYQSSHLTSNLVPRECLHRVYRDIFRIRLAFFCTLKVVSGELYEEKILEKIPSVPLMETYQLSNLTTHFVPSRIPNSWFTKLKNVKITFFKQKTSFSAGKYRRKIPEKIPEFLLDSI